jgi:hypothetical protein
VRQALISGRQYVKGSGCGLFDMHLLGGSQVLDLHSTALQCMVLVYLPRVESLLVSLTLKNAAILLPDKTCDTTYALVMAAMHACCSCRC